MSYASRARQIKGRIDAKGAVHEVPTVQATKNGGSFAKPPSDECEISTKIISIGHEIRKFGFLASNDVGRVKLEVMLLLDKGGRPRSQWILEWRHARSTFWADETLVHPSKHIMLCQ